MKAKRQSRGGRRRIGVIFNTIRFPQHAPLLDGIRAAAQSAHVDLFCFDAAACDGLPPASPAKAFFLGLPNKRVIDGLLLLPGFENENPRQANQALKRFHPLPLVTIGWKTSGATSVVVDAKKGIAALIAHLMDVHGCKRITLICGQVDGKAADEISAQVAAALKRRKLDPSGILLRSCATLAKFRSAVRALLEEKTQGPEAIIVDSPDTALLVRKALAARRPASRDQTPLAILMTDADGPPDPDTTALTLPCEELGKAGIRIILSRLAGKKDASGKTARTTVEPEIACACGGGSMRFRQDRQQQTTAPLLGEVLDALTAVQTPLELKKTLQAYFPRLGIAECCLSLWDSDRQPLHYSRPLAGFSHRHKLSALDTATSFLTNRLLPPNAFRTGSPCCYFVEPLFDGDAFPGILIFSSPGFHPNFADALRRTLRGILTGFRLRREAGTVRNRNETEVSALTRRLLDANERLQKEKRHAEKLSADLKRSELQHKRWFEDDFTGDFITDSEGRITACNNAFARIFGFKSAHQALGAKFADFYPHQSSVDDFYTLLGVVRRIEYYESEFVRKDGNVIHVIGNIIGTFDADNNLVEMQGFLYDNTERKHLEDELRHAHKMDAIGKLSGGIAHDFNNILTGIMGYAELLLNKIPKSDPSRKDVEEIKKAAKSAASLTRQLLAFSRKQILKPLVLDLNDVVRNMHDLLVRVIGEHISLVTELEAELSPVKADRGQIEQVIMNLVLNARDALPEGGSIVVITRNRVIGEKDAGAGMIDIKPGCYVVLEICDDGMGMDLETQNRIFEPFFTTKKIGQGVGLGLSTVYGIISQSGGYTDVKSEPGRGTTMRIYLQQHTAGVDMREEHLEYQDEVRGSGTILLVEDEQMVRDTAQKILTGEGYHVIAADNAQEALSHIRRHSLEFDLVITDIVMPGMSGIELGQKIQAMRPGIRVLLMSGYDERILGDRGQFPFMHHFIPKPFSPDVLLRKVQDVLNR